MIHFSLYCFSLKFYPSAPGSSEKKSVLNVTGISNSEFSQSSDNLHKKLPRRYWSLGVRFWSQPPSDNCCLLRVWSHGLLIINDLVLNLLALLFFFFYHQCFGTRMLFCLISSQFQNDVNQFGVLKLYSVHFSPPKPRICKHFLHIFQNNSMNYPLMFFVWYSLMVKLPGFYCWHPINHIVVAPWNRLHLWHRDISLQWIKQILIPYPNNKQRLTFGSAPPG